uniref:Chemokine interleukin-8-like domain-containing protein n=1 Tax=Podarcis muralis TaxID=64176 RepID=A0A670IH90_PODMU
MKLYTAAILTIAFFELFRTLGSQTMALDSCITLDTNEMNIRRFASYTTQTRPVKCPAFIIQTSNLLLTSIQPEANKILAAILCKSTQK